MTTSTPSTIVRIMQTLSAKQPVLRMCAIRLLLLVLICSGAQATTYYMDPNGGGDGSTWDEACPSWQELEEMEWPLEDGDIVLCSNGVYDVGGIAASGATLTNRFFINKAITVRSVNGPNVTIIKGANSGGGLGPRAVRCAYLTNGAQLIGFTLTNGYTMATGSGVLNQDGGGAFLHGGGTISSCVVVNCHGDGGGGIGVRGSTATIKSCSIVSNSAEHTGGGVIIGSASRASVIDCTIAYNTADLGGGLENNSETYIENCTIVSNVADGAGTYGGGVGNSLGTLVIVNSTISGNSSASVGGGLYDGFNTYLLNTIIINNSATSSGDDIHCAWGAGCYGYYSWYHDVDGTVNGQANAPNVTNAYTGGDLSALADNGGFGETMELAATAPAAETGAFAYTNSTVGCYFVDNVATSHTLTNWSVNPTVSAGDKITVDQRGETRADPVDMGAYELPSSNPDNVYVDASRADDSGDGASWATAKKTIQAGVDAVSTNGTVWVTNGVYDAGSRIAPGQVCSNRVCITNAITLRSVNGPEYTFISGAPGSNGSNDLDSIRGVFMTNGCSLIGFTITNGYTVPYVSGNHIDASGAGVLVSTNCVVSNVVLRGNSTDPSAWGGGALLWYGGTMNNSRMIGNRAGSGGGVEAVYGGAINNCEMSGNENHQGGGGAGAAFYFGGIMRNCTVTDNYTPYRGGGVMFAAGGVVYNSIVFGNTADQADNDIYFGGGGTVDHTCASDGVTHGTDGCITNNPVFLDAANSNFQLQAISPCVNTGDNTYAPTNVTPVDLAGNPRIIYSTVDMGAYEYAAYYVDASKADDSGDGYTWATAKKTIQAAVDLAVDRTTVWVTNGVYDVGGAVTPGGVLSNRVVITKAIAVRSMNGREKTMIVGGGDYGLDTGVRCVYMTNGCSLGGFTITNGNTRSSAGDIIPDWCGGGVWLSDGCVVSNCLLTHNRAQTYGGGAFAFHGGLLLNCEIITNRALDGAGIYLYGNGEAANCLVRDCVADNTGGGIYLYDGGIMNNCTIVRNTANDSFMSGEAAGVHCEDSTINNSISMLNLPFRNLTRINSNIRYTDTTEGITNGVDGCIADNPLFGNASSNDFTLQSSSPCRNTGNNTYAPTNVSPYDVAGNPRIVNGTVDMGAYEVQVVPAADLIYVDASRPDDSGDGESWATAKKTIQAGVDTVSSTGSVWVTNGIYNAGGMAAAGQALTNRVCITNAITVQSVNGAEVTIIEGAPGSSGSNDVDAIRGVYMMNGCSLIGFTVTNGFTSSSGERNGGGIWMTTNCVASNLIVSGNGAFRNGGGVYFSLGGMMNNCTLNGNWADSGGGASFESGGTMNNCLLRDNTADVAGGAYLYAGGMMNNCTLVENSARANGGAVFDSGGTINNGIAYLNSASIAANDIGGSGGTVRYTCASDGVTHGVDGCITNNPLFIDAANSNSQLQAISPCINNGNNTYAPTNVSPVDLAGSPRILDGTVDMGAYEYVEAYYADASRPDDSGDGYSWATAKKTIQAAVDIALDGKTVWVTNGLYNTGSKVTPGLELTNRVCITKAITVQSVNGPTVTIIEGSFGSNGSNDADAVRGVYMTNSCSLSGFTVRDGCTLETGGDPSQEGCGGGIWLSINCTVSNCILYNNGAVLGGGGIYAYDGGLIDGCTVYSNFSFTGGGVFLDSYVSQGGTLIRSLVTDNEGFLSGGGVYLCENCRVDDCVIASNSVLDSGGGFFLDQGGVVTNCLIAHNEAAYGGGALIDDFQFAEIEHCTIRDNYAEDAGGGVYLADNGMVNNCLIYSNLTEYGGGGAVLDWGGSLNSCLIYANSSTTNGGGGTVIFDAGDINNCTIYGNDTPQGDGGGSALIDGGSMNNCIIWGNTAPASTNKNIYREGSASYFYTCSPDGIVHGAFGCITNNPQLVNGPHDLRLRPTSPCFNAGDNSYVFPAITPTDMAGEPRISFTTVDIGAYELTYQPSSASGPHDGGNTITITNIAALGDGSDITNVTVGGSVATVVDQGTDWVTITLGMAADNDTRGNILIQSTTVGDTTLAGAYTYNPKGFIGNEAGWQDVTGLPVVLDTGNAVAYSNMLYSVGGTVAGSSSTNVYRYDGTSWTPMAGLPGPRRAMGCVVYNGLLYAIGGIDASSVQYTNVYTFDGTSWSETVGLPYAVCEMGCSIWNGKIYCIGGGGGGTELSSVCSFDGTSWTMETSLPGTRTAISAQTLNGTLYAMGGFDNPSAYTNVWTFDGSSWTEVAGYPSICCAAGTTVRDGLIYSFGGTGAGGHLTNCWTFDGTAWTEIEGLPRTLYAPAAATYNGQVYCVGGYYNGGGSGTTNVMTYPSYTDGVSPANCSVDGGVQVTINGVNLGDGSDITNVTLCGVEVTSIDSQSSTQVIVTAAAGSPSKGDINLYSTGYGATFKADGFSYYQLSTNAGPAAGGNTITITNGTLGSASDITNVTVCGSTAAILDQGDNWVQVVLGASTNAYLQITGDVVIQSTVVGDTVYANAYTYYRGIGLTFYADSSKADDSGDGFSWATAKQSIQAAVDLTLDGDLVLVTNGTYDTGGIATPGFGLTNRVYIDKIIEVRSVNGPGVTIISGASDPGTSGRGNAAIRGVFMTNGCSLTGFTITNGHTRQAGDIDVDQCGGGLWITTNCVASNLVVHSNAAYYGGGVYLLRGGILRDSTVSQNSAVDGGGAYLAYGSWVVNCSFVDNHVVQWGAGAYLRVACLLDRCAFKDNSSQWQGGGAFLYASTMNNCLLTGNTASDNGGGAYLHYGTANNCTMSDNNSGADGGGAFLDNGTVNNCIMFGNTASGSGNDLNVSSGNTRYTCASDGLTNGVNGNITNAPLYMDSAGTNYQLRLTSPCFNAGDNGYAQGAYDLAGDTRIMFGTVDMGAYEAQFMLSAYTGPLAGGNTLTITNGALGSGSDITNVLVGGTAAVITGQGTSWVTITLPAASAAGAVDIRVQSVSQGETLIENAYTYNPAGTIEQWVTGPDAWTNAHEQLYTDVHALKYDGQGHLYVGGNFTNSSTMGAHYFAMWDGVSWTNLGEGLNSAIRAMAMDTNGLLYVGGAFTTAGGISANRIACYDTVNGTWTNLSYGMNNAVWALAVGPDNELYAGGMFSTAGGISSRSVSKWNPATRSWSSLGTGLNAGYAMALAVDSNGLLYVGGGFTNAGTASDTRYLAMWDPNAGTWTNLGPTGANAYVDALELDDAGNLYVGGRFTTCCGISANRIAKLAPDGTWTNLGSGMNSYVFALGTGTNNNLYAGGGFTTAGGVPSRFVASYDLASGTWTNMGLGVNNQVFAMEQGLDGVYAGGWITTAGVYQAAGLGRYAGTIAELSGVAPSSGSWTGGYPVVITGTNLCNGSDVTNVTLCGFDVSSIESQSGTQVTVLAGSTGGPFSGDVVVYSTSYGATVRSNAFTYLAPIMIMLGTNGGWIASEDSPYYENGTLFRPIPPGLALTNSFGITNLGNITLDITGWTTNGTGADQFHVVDMPLTVDAGTVSNFHVIYQPGSASSHTATVQVASSDVYTPYRLNLGGSSFSVSTNNGPYVGGNTITITNGSLGDGSDITNVLVGGVSATITGQGVNWVTITLPTASAAGSVSVRVQSVSQGETLLQDAYTYNPKGGLGITSIQDAWEEVEGLPGSRYNGAMDTFEGYLYYAAGFDGSTRTTNVFRYDGTNWSEVSGLPGERNNCEMAVYDNGLYLLGGMDSATMLMTNVYRFDGTNWTEVTGLPDAQQTFGAGTLNDTLYVFGGYHITGVKTNTYAYNGTAWTEVSGLPTATVNMAYSVYQDKLYSIGGIIGTYVTNVCAFDGTNWSASVGLPQPSGLGAAATLDDRLYMSGGTASGTVHDTAYRFDGTNWNVIACMPQALKMHKMARLGAHIYVAGGTTNTVPVTNVYRYPIITETPGVVPASGSWTGGYPVVISGTNLCNGGDVTNVILCGIPVLSIDSQSPTQIIVTAAASTSGSGDVVIQSVSFGTTLKSNAFTYLEPIMSVLGTNGAAIASGDAAVTANGTDFGSLIVGAGSLTNTFSITNSGNTALHISGVTTSGTGATSFSLNSYPATVDAGAIEDFSAVFTPDGGGALSAALHFANDGTTTPYVVNLAGFGSGGGIAPETNLLSFVAIYAGSSPADQYLLVDNVGVSSFTYSNVIAYSTGASGWLTSLPDTDTVPQAGSVTLTNIVNTTGLNAGTYYATNMIIAADATNSPQTVRVTLVVTPANQTITFPHPGAQETTNHVGLAATATSGLPVSFNVGSGPGTISGGTNLSFTGAGDVILTASQAGNSNWNAAASITHTIAVSKATAEVILGSLSQVYDGTARAVTSSTDPIGLTVNLSYDGHAWAPTNAGSYAITGIVSDVMYQGWKTDTLVVAKADQVITFPQIPDQTYTSRVGLAASASSGQEVYFFTNYGSARFSGVTNLYFTGTGAVSILAYQYGDGNWNAALATNNFMVNKADQVIDFPAIADQITTNLTVLTATCTSSNPVIFEIVSGEADLTDLSNLTYRTDGVVVVRASQPGSNYWNAAPPVTNTFNVTKAIGTVTLSDLTQVYDGTEKYPTDQTDPSNLTVNLTFDGGTNRPVNVGTYEVIGTMDDPMYQDAATNTFTIVQATQTISFAQIPDQVITGLVGLAATGGDSTNPVTFSVLSGPAAIAGATNLSFSNVGEIQIIANQAGDSNYLVAATVTNIFNVSPVQPAIDSPTVSNILSKTASLGATITSTNGAPVTQRGVLWRVDGSTNVYVSMELGSYGTGPFSVNVTGIIAGVTNYYQAYARNVSGTVYTAESSFLARPDAPELTGATNIQAESFYANWNAAIGATNYYIDVSETNTFASFIPGYNNRDVGNVLSVSVTGLGSSIYYYYRVRSLNDTGVSTNSEIWETGLMMDLLINALPTEHDTPAPLGYGANPVIVNTIVTNTVTTPAEESNGVRYASTGWSGTGDVPATGTANTVTFLFAQDSTLTWHWKTQYELTQSASGGTIDGLTDGWKDEGWIFDLVPVANNGYVFNRWRTNGVNAGTSKLLTVVADSPVAIEAIFTSSAWDVDTQGTVTMTGYRLDTGSGLFYCTFRVCNPSGASVTLRDRFLYAMDPDAMTFLNDPDGTSPTGKEYKDVTAEVKSKLQSVGNGDQIMDPGECVTLNEIAFWTRNPNDITSYFYSRGTPIMNDRDTDGDGIPNDWEDREGLNKNNPYDAGQDQDDDGVISGEEYVADTKPFDGSSYLHIFSIVPDPTSGEDIGWIGGTSVVQDLEWAPAMTGTWTRIQRFNPPTQTTNDWSNDPAQSPGFYRIRAVR